TCDGQANDRRCPSVRFNIQRSHRLVADREERGIVGAQSGGSVKKSAPGTSTCVWRVGEILAGATARVTTPERSVPAFVQALVDRGRRSLRRCLRSAPPARHKHDGSRRLTRIHSMKYKNESATATS